jgi:hypothetical protein
VDVHGVQPDTTGSAEVVTGVDIVPTKNVRVKPKWRAIGSGRQLRGENAAGNLPMPNAFSSWVGYRLVGCSLTIFACEHTTPRDKAAHHFVIISFAIILHAKDERLGLAALWRG